MEKEITIKTDLCEDDVKCLVRRLNNFFKEHEFNVSLITKNRESASGHIYKEHSIMIEYKPYEDCSKCEHKDKKCKVWDRFQRYPREDGGSGMCIKIGGRGN